MWKPLSQSQTDITKIWSLRQTFHINRDNGNISNTADLKVFIVPLLKTFTLSTERNTVLLLSVDTFFLYLLQTD